LQKGENDPKRSFSAARGALEDFGEVRLGVPNLSHENHPSQSLARLIHPLFQRGLASFEKGGGHAEGVVGGFWLNKLGVRICLTKITRLNLT